MADLEHGYKITTDPPMDKREKSKLLESYFIWDTLKPFHEIQCELPYVHQWLCVAGLGCLISIFKMWPDKKIYTMGEKC